MGGGGGGGQDGYLGRIDLDFQLKTCQVGI